jgi:hypothetical protein
MLATKNKLLRLARVRDQVEVSSFTHTTEDLSSNQLMNMKKMSS